MCKKIKVVEEIPAAAKKYNLIWRMEGIPAFYISRKNEVPSLRQILCFFFCCSGDSLNVQYCIFRRILHHFGGKFKQLDLDWYAESVFIKSGDSPYLHFHVILIHATDGRAGPQVPKQMFPNPLMVEIHYRVGDKMSTTSKICINQQKWIDQARSAIAGKLGIASPTKFLPWQNDWL